MFRQICARTLRVLGLSAAALCAPGAHAQGWDFMDLGSFVAGSSHATGINNAGQVVGYGALSSASSTPHTGFLYSDGATTITGPYAGYSTQLYGINDLGVAVGGAEDIAAAYTYSSGAMTAIPGVAPLSWPVSINDAGQIAIVTAQMINGGSNSSYLYSGGSFTDLGSLGGGNTNAAAINNLGQITGGTYTSAGQQQAFLYSGGVMTGIGRLDGARVTIPTAMNDAGTIVGYSFDANQDSGYQYASIYSNGQWSKLLPASSDALAYGINNRGDVVGVDRGRGFLYSNGSYVDLMNIPQVQAAGWHTMTATDINDRGQIVGYGSYRQNDDFFTHAFLLSPSALGGGGAGGVGSVPEPESTGLMVVGLGLLAWLTRRRRQPHPD